MHTRLFSFSLLVLLLVVLSSSATFAARSSAPAPTPGAQRALLPITTKYYSLSLPPDWVVLRGPEKSRDNIQLQLADAGRATVVTLAVGTVTTGEAKKVTALYAKQLGVKGIEHEGQTEFFLHHGREKACVIVREAKKDKLILILSVSGMPEKADFLFALKTPYPDLMPVRPTHF